jgi:hypothetical protein
MESGSMPNTKHDIKRVPLSTYVDQPVMQALKRQRKKTGESFRSQINRILNRAFRRAAIA